MKSLLSALLLLCLVPLPAKSHASESGHGSLRLLPDSPNYLSIAAGSFEGFDDLDNAFTGQVEYRYGKKLLYIGPLVGVLANTDGGIIGFAGIYLDIGIGDFILSPQTGVGAYEKGKSKDLGGTFEFISGLGLSYQFAEGSRLGFRYQHISNANLHSTNPGADILLLNYGIPF